MKLTKEILNKKLFASYRGSGKEPRNHYEVMIRTKNQARYVSESPSSYWESQSLGQAETKAVQAAANKPIIKTNFNFFITYGV